MQFYSKFPIKIGAIKGQESDERTTKIKNKQKDIKWFKSIHINLTNLIFQQKFIKIQPKQTCISLTKLTKVFKEDSLIATYSESLFSLY